MKSDTGLSQIEKNHRDYTILDRAKYSIWYLLPWGLLFLDGWVEGLILYMMTIYVISFALKKRYKLEMLSALDELSFLDDGRNSTNILAYKRCAKIDNIDEMRSLFNDRVCRFSRLKSKIRKVCGRFMFEEQTDEQVRGALSVTMPTVEGIHDEE